MALRPRKLSGAFEKRAPGQQIFSRLINSDWSIQISGVAGVGVGTDKELHDRCTTRVLTINLRGCLHDTGATFAPERVHSGSLSWLYICLHDTTTKCYAGASHPGVSSPRFSHRGENFTPVRNLATVSCKRETTTHFGVKLVCR